MKATAGAHLHAQMLRKGNGVAGGEEVGEFFEMGKSGSSALQNKSTTTWKLPFQLIKRGFPSKSCDKEPRGQVRASVLCEVWALDTARGMHHETIPPRLEMLNCSLSFFW